MPVSPVREGTLLQVKCSVVLLRSKNGVGAVRKGEEAIARGGILFTANAMEVQVELHGRLVGGLLAKGNHLRSSGKISKNGLLPNIFPAHVGTRTADMLLLFTSPSVLDEVLQHMAHLRPVKTRSEIILSAFLNFRFPWVNPDVLSHLLSPSDGDTHAVPHTGEPKDHEQPPTAHSRVHSRERLSIKAKWRRDHVVHHVLQHDELVALRNRQPYERSVFLWKERLLDTTLQDQAKARLAAVPAFQEILDKQREEIRIQNPTTLSLSTQVLLLTDKEDTKRFRIKRNEIFEASELRKAFDLEARTIAEFAREVQQLHEAFDVKLADAIFLKSLKDKKPDRRGTLCPPHTKFAALMLSERVCRVSLLPQTMVEEQEELLRLNIVDEQAHFFDVVTYYTEALFPECNEHVLRTVDILEESARARIRQEEIVQRIVVLAGVAKDMAIDTNGNMPVCTSPVITTPPPAVATVTQRLTYSPMSESPVSYVQDSDDDDMMSDESHCMDVVEEEEVIEEEEEEVLVYDSLSSSSSEPMTPCTVCTRFPPKPPQRMPTWGACSVGTDASMLLQDSMEHHELACDAINTVHNEAGVRSAACKVAEQRIFTMATQAWCFKFAENLYTEEELAREQKGTVEFFRQLTTTLDKKQNAREALYVRELRMSLDMLHSEAGERLLLLDRLVGYEVLRRKMREAGNDLVDREREIAVLADADPDTPELYGMFRPLKDLEVKSVERLKVIEAEEQDTASRLMDEYRWMEMRGIAAEQRLLARAEGLEDDVTGLYERLGGLCSEVAEVEEDVDVLKKAKATLQDTMHKEKAAHNEEIEGEVRKADKTELQLHALRDEIGAMNREMKQGLDFVNKDCAGLCTTECNMWAGSLAALLSIEASARAILEAQWMEQCPAPLPPPARRVCSTDASAAMIPVLLELISYESARQLQVSRTLTHTTQQRDCMMPSGTAFSFLQMNETSARDDIENEHCEGLLRFYNPLLCTL